MKKMKVLLASVLTLIVCLFCFAGCGTTGTYKLQSLTVKTVVGTSTTYEVGEEYNGEKLEADYATLELKKDGTAVFTLDNTSYECTWEEAEDGSITFNGVNLPLSKATVDGSEMTIEVNIIVTTFTIVMKKGLF